MSKRYRDFGPALLLLAVSGLLAVAALWQWSHYRAKEVALKNRLAAKVEVHLPAPPAEPSHDGLPGLEGFTATVERPLFMENRKPGEAEVKVDPPVHVEHLPLSAKLMGVVFAPKQAIGLFVDAQGKYKRLGKNDSIDGWKLVEIQQGKAVLERDGTREELKLLKVKPKTPHNPLTPGAPPVPGFPGQPLPGQPPVPNPFAPNPQVANPPPPSPDVPIQPEPVFPNPNDAADPSFQPAGQPEPLPNDQ